MQCCEIDRSISDVAWIRQIRYVFQHRRCPCHRRCSSPFAISTVFGAQPLIDLTSVPLESCRRARHSLACAMPARDATNGSSGASFQRAAVPVWHASKLLDTAVGISDDYHCSGFCFAASMYRSIVASKLTLPEQSFCLVRKPADQGG